MKEWVRRYRKSINLLEEEVDVLTGFNANIDVIHRASELDIESVEIKTELFNPIDSEEKLKCALKECMEKGENHEVDIQNFSPELPGKESLGGQAGIISNFLSGLGKGVIFYTPLLSKKLAQHLNEKVLYPVIDGNFVLKNVQDASNTDRTKKNHIFEYEADRTGRLILSDSLKGFGPYFRKGVEDNLQSMTGNVECCIFSGFHDVEGNKQAKLEKSARQLSKIDKPVHLEYVHKTQEKAKLIQKYIIPEVDSIGLDEDELKNLSDTGKDSFNLGEAFESAKYFIEKHNIERLHLHSMRYHMTVVEKSYPVSDQQIRNAMLFGELGAIQAAEKGKIPERDDIKDFNMEKKHLQDLDYLREFEEFFELEDFTEEGIAEVEGYRIIAIPTIVHEDPKRTVGMGDIISSGAFAFEFRSGS